MTHPDRTATQDHRQCCAYGCPMPGSMSDSIGSSKWVCAMHHGQDPGRWQRITADLRRMQWLVTAITTLRRDYDSARWNAAYAEADQIMRHHQRSDLWHFEGEKLPAWFARLDAALLASCRVIEEPSQQLPLVQ
jgi:hypothetical protein